MQLNNTYISMKEQKPTQHISHNWNLFSMNFAVIRVYVLKVETGHIIFLLNRLMTFKSIQSYRQSQE